VSSSSGAQLPLPHTAGLQRQRLTAHGPRQAAGQEALQCQQQVQAALNLMKPTGAAAHPPTGSIASTLPHVRNSCALLARGIIMLSVR
jgi:hypothetical protein